MPRAINLQHALLSPQKISKIKASDKWINHAHFKLSHKNVTKNAATTKQKKRNKSSSKSPTFVTFQLIVIFLHP